MKHTALQKHTKSVNRVPYVQLWGYTSPMDAEDDGIEYFHSAYCSISSSPSWPMSASLNHFLLSKVTAAKIHVKRMARRVEYREVAWAGSITASGICQGNQAMGLFLGPQSSWNIVKRNKQVHLVLLELWLTATWCTSLVSWTSFRPQHLDTGKVIQTVSDV